MEVEKTLGILIEQGRWMSKEITLLREDVRVLRDFKVRISLFASVGAFLATLVVEFFRRA